jgi:CBS domain containing-hemolysin-like protein
MISIQVVLGEQVPKVTALQAPERFAANSAPWMQVFIGIVRGFIFVLDGAARAILAVFGISANGHAHSTTFSVEDLRQMVSGTEAAGMIEPPESKMLSAVIDFGGLVARQVSVPRTEVIAIQAAVPIAEAARIVMQHGVTKLPVYEESLDQICGILHLKDLLPALLTNDRLNNRPAGELARDALFVPESIPVNDLLVQMRARRQHIAITLDEFGGTAGLVTLEDLIEEIVGDVRDPFDVHQPDIQPLSDGTALLDGMALIEEINDAFGASLYDPDYDTIAGYMLGKLGRIAQIGDEVVDTENGFRLRVESMDRLRIARIHLTRITDSP